MSLIYNGTEITAANYNGTALTSIVYNGTEVWSSVTPATCTITGWGSSNTSVVSITKTSDFPTSFEDWTDSNGNIFVKIPTFYRQITQTSSGQISATIMSTTQIDSTYEPYSVFVKPDGTVMDYVYIGKYQASSSTICNSVNATRVSQTVSNGRTNAQAWGDGYQLYDWQFQKLFQDLCVAVKGTVDFQPGTSAITNYLGVCHLDQSHWVDGVARDGSTWVFATNPTNYIDSPTSSSTGYNVASYAAPDSSRSTGEISVLGYDTNYPFFNYPNAIVTNSSYNTYYCDVYYYSSSQTNAPVRAYVGGASAYDGLWFCSSNYSWSNTYGVRLCYRPL